MRVLLPGALLSYTGASRIEAAGATLGEVLGELEKRYPGIRFRMVDERERVRPHIRFFVDGVPAGELAQPLAGCRELAIVQALSGG